MGAMVLFFWAEYSGRMWAGIGSTMGSYLQSVLPIEKAQLTAQCISEKIRFKKKKKFTHYILGSQLIWYLHFSKY